MHAVAHDLQSWILQQEEFVKICNEAGIDPVQVIWSDDLACEAAQLPGALSNLLGFVRDTFQSRGFRLNLAKNKTSAVLTFRGKGAPQMRRDYLLAGRGGCNVRFTDQSEQWLHFLPAYKHLGTYYTADQDLDYEIRYRLGMARSAFVGLSNAVFCNRRIPAHLRFRLFQSLVETRLYFGCGSWSTPRSGKSGVLSQVCAERLEAGSTSMTARHRPRFSRKREC